MPDEMSDKEKQELFLGVREEEGPVPGWNEAMAESLAEEQGIEMSDNHWAVVRFLRDQYKANGPFERARKIAEALDEQFASQGGSKYLYTLFPKGPVTQGCRIAGVPAPMDSTDQSFGSAF
jgi:TusE/DsrC/DsvC family sulfur relay protein